MTLSERYIRAAQWLLPSPLTIAVLLTFITLLLALTCTSYDGSTFAHLLAIGGYWQQGFWDLLTFAMQMMLILVLGHALALTKPIERLIHLVADRATNTAKAAFWVCLTTMIMGLINWGLGLIFGAILARKIAEFAKEKNYPVHYPLVAACGYTALMVWHGGLSGSATLKVTESNHFLVETMGQIPLSETIFSSMNIAISLGLLIIIPITMAFIGKRMGAHGLEGVHPSQAAPQAQHYKLVGAEKLDNASWLCRGFALFFLGLAVYELFFKGDQVSLDAINLNFINFVFFGLALWFLGTFNRFGQAVEEAITGAAGIMVQFPLYAGIAGIMKYSGLIHLFSDFIVNVATPATFSLWTLFSAGLVNMFVPSGGGQWAVQGPIIADAASTLNVPFSKAIMAFAYGDQLTNMLQPFWALPLLGITKLKAKDILPYTFILMVLATAIFVVGLLVF